MSLRSLLLALSRRPGIGRAMDRWGATRRLVRRFVAGTTPADALAVIRDLNARGIGGLVTYLGENVRTPADAEHATGVYLALLAEARRCGLDCAPSLKLTHLGLDLDTQLCETNLTRILERGAGARVWIDMESSAYTERTLDLYARLRPRHPGAATVVQAYLRRTPGDVERLVTLGAALRLCKGAYQEPAALAFPDQRDVDAAYARLAERLLAPDARARGVFPGFATHDERLQRFVIERARTLGVPAEVFEIQMLYGIRHDLHAPLRAGGVGVRVLVPFGEDWYGYFMRRLAERPANLVFLLRNLVKK
ncbi:MAG: proline dehydrogenase family protein [Candidatus Rokubacteria bacterium]|nr:proline dehydrogenase family protein [Candidatus Rokubacteria bacterium]MBI3825360.1 proline dehydrogenase family protein [Candidatus Rokubacteria bacterium]